MVIHELFVYLRAKNSNQAVDFYRHAFGASEKFRLVEPGGRIGHVELDLGGTTILISDEFPEYGMHAPDPDARGAFLIHLHVDDADALIERAGRFGATLTRAPEDQFYGERSGTIRDPFGYDWLVGHSIENVSPEEMQRRYTEICSSEE